MPARRQVQLLACRSARRAGAMPISRLCPPCAPHPGNSYNIVPTLSLNVIKTFLEGSVLPTLAAAESTYNTMKAAE